MTALLLPAGGALAQEDAFNPPAVVRATIAVIEQTHLSQRPVDDGKSRKWLLAFLDRLDPQRMYFLQPDFDELRVFEDRLDNLARQDDFSFPERVRKRYQQRVNEAAIYAAEFLSARHDFSLNEELPIRFETYAGEPGELRERWRLRIKGELLIETVHGRPLPEVQTQLAGRYQRIVRSAQEMSDQRLCQIYLEALTSTCDPHSQYLSQDFLDQFEQTVTIPAYTLGLGLQQREGHQVITSVHPSLGDLSARTRMIGWRVLAIRRTNGSILDLVEMHSEDVWDLIRSPSGPLGTDQEIGLELFNGATYERRTVDWIRFLTR